MPISPVYTENNKNIKVKLYSKSSPDKINPPQTINSYFERLFVDVNVISSLYLPGLTEEDEVFKQEDLAEVFPATTPDHELILAAELTLFFQIHLERKHGCLHTSARTMRFLVGV